MKQKKILFVCTGNTCRSIIAQALFQKEKEDSNPGLNYQAHSAGIAAINGKKATPEAIFCMAKYGIDIASYQARQVEESMIIESSFVLVMTHQHLEYLKKHFPLAANKMFMLRPFCWQRNQIINEEVEDPYGKHLSFYEKICQQLKQDINKLIYCLRARGDS